MTRRVLVVTASLALLIAVCAMWFVKDESADRSFPTTAEATYTEGESVSSFKNVGEMVATSAFAFEGTVLRVEQGDPVDYDDGSGGVIVPRVLVVEVSKVFHTRSPEPEVPSSLLVVDGYWEDGVGYERESIGWAQPGESGFFLVRPSRHPNGDFTGRYTPLDGGNGIALIEGSQVEYDHHAVWKMLGSSATPAVFRNAVSQGARAAENGTAKPVLRTICYPSVPDDENSEPICVKE